MSFRNYFVEVPSAVKYFCQQNVESIQWNYCISSLHKYSNGV